MERSPREERPGEAGGGRGPEEARAGAGCGGDGQKPGAVEVAGRLAGAG